MSRRRYILEQVFTRAGCTRYLHTFGSSGARSRSNVTSIRGVVSLSRERERKRRKNPMDASRDADFGAKRSIPVPSTCDSFFSIQKES